MPRAEPRPRRHAARREVLCADLDHLASEHAAWGPLPGDAPADDDALCEALRRALDTALTPRQRTMVEGHFFEGLSQGEIARRMGVTQQVVHKCLYGDARNGRVVGGAIARLRAALAPVASARYAT